MSANPLPIIITAIDDSATIGYFAAKFAIALGIMTILLPCMMCCCGCCLCLGCNSGMRRRSLFFSKGKSNNEEPVFDYVKYTEMHSGDYMALTKLDDYKHKDDYSSKSKKENSNLVQKVSAVYQMLLDIKGAFVNMFRCRSRSKMSDTPMQHLGSSNSVEVVLENNVDAKKPNESVVTPTNVSKKRRVFVYTFDTLSEGNTGMLKSASGSDDSFKLLESFANIISSKCTPERDEIALVISSPGGSALLFVRTYTAIMQLLNKKGFNVVALVDDIAASGGYLLACACNKIYCAERSMIGSIGVISSAPNFHKLLDKTGVEVKRFVTGPYKGGFPSMEPYTEDHVKHEYEHLNEMYAVFKDIVKQARPNVNIDEVATGNVWKGTEAVTMKLADENTTVTEYLRNEAKTKDVYMVQNHNNGGLLNSLFSMSANFKKMAVHMLEYFVKDSNSVENIEFATQ